MAISAIARSARRFRCARLMLLALCFLALLLPPRDAAGGAPITPQAALHRFVTAPRLQEGWFAPAFLAQVSLAQLESVRGVFMAQLGAFRGSAHMPDGSFLLRFARGTDVAQIALDPQGRIAGLLFKPPTIVGATLRDAVRGFRALPGTVSVLVLASGATLAEFNGTHALGVGSAFKLAVLAALEGQIAAGLHRWDQVVTVRAADRSLPSGILQSWPAGSRLTIETLASLMISQSDNTAADTLIHLVGRPAIDALIPARDRPILTTHALFVLKDPAHAALLRAYRAGTATQRLAIVERADRLPPPSISIFDGGPRDLDIEWFFTPRQLCRLIDRVHALPLMGINPGLVQGGDWRSVAFKGGSEPGVLNLTTELTADDGTTFCVVATWNNTTVLDEPRFEALYTGLLAALK